MCMLACMAIGNAVKMAWQACWELSCEPSCLCCEGRIDKCALVDTSSGSGGDGDAKMVDEVALVDEAE